MHFSVLSCQHMYYRVYRIGLLIANPIHYLVKILKGNPFSTFSDKNKGCILCMCKMATIFHKVSDRADPSIISA